MPYGEVAKLRQHPEGEQLQQFIRQFGQANRHLAGKRKDFKAAWFVSHCQTRGGREKILPALQSFMQVDTYGDCFDKLTCNKGGLRHDLNPQHSCKKMAEQSYKFYLSFENTICNDYVTEKFFHFLFTNIIPVTFGGAEYSAIAPPHSYINALDFASVEDLVAYMREIHEDDAKFAEYFWWKEYYEPRDTRFSPRPLCELCQRLRNPLEPRKWYSDLPAWWWNVNGCRKLIDVHGEEGRFEVVPANRLSHSLKHPLCFKPEGHDNTNI